MLLVFITEEGFTTYTSASVAGNVGIASPPQLSHHCLATLFWQKASSVNPRGAPLIYAGKKMAIRS